MHPLQDLPHVKVRVICDVLDRDGIAGLLHDLGSDHLSREVPDRLPDVRWDPGPRSDHYLIVAGYVESDEPSQKMLAVLIVLDEELNLGGRPHRSQRGVEYKHAVLVDRH